MKLQKKYFLTFFALFLVLSIALSMTSYFISRSILINKYKELNAENMSYLSDVTDKEMTQLISFFEFIGSYEALQERITTTYGEDDDYKKMLEDQEVTDLFISLNADDLFSAIELIYIQGDAGEEYWYGVGNDYLRVENVHKILENNVYEKGKLNYKGIGYSYNGIHPDLKVLRFTRQFVDLSGKPYGRIYFELKASYLENIYHSDRLLTGMKINVSDQSGMLLYDAISENIGTQKEIMESEGIVTTYTTENFGWQISSVTPIDYVTEDGGNIVRMTMIMAAVSILTALIAITIITSRFVKPIKSLTTAVDEVVEGDYSVTVDHVSNDEIGELADRFNVMTGRIKGNIEKELSHSKAMNDAEYKALQSQINPHFMYNSLNTLKWIASLQGADSIIEVVDALWLLLKKSSSHKGQIVTLENEIEVIDAFVLVQQARYNGKFDITYEIEPTHMKNLIPKYIIQPLVENAIFHGIEPKEGQGRITLKSEMVDQDLLIHVMDDGVGVDEKRIKWILSSVKESEHTSGLNNIGVKNVDERLRLLYGQAYGIVFDSVIGEGSTVTIRIPVENK